MIFTIGLAVIVIGWIVQIYKTSVKKDRALSPVFLALYAIGCVFLSAGNFLGNDVTSGILNAFCVILSAIILITLIVQKETV
jgi:predicted anti-sigma-YlaC factor YlaD